jgi:hypothetical protein
MDKFIFKKNKNNNYTILSKRGKRIRFKLKGIYIPFGIEQYNDKSIINFLLDPSKQKDNNNHNNIVNLKKYIKYFIKLKDEQYFDFEDKDFYNFLTEEDNDRLLLRTYLGNGIRITKKNLIGEYDIKTISLKNKIVNVKFEFGSLWYNNSIKKYGINIFATDIIIQ